MKGEEKLGPRDRDYYEMHEKAKESAPHMAEEPIPSGARMTLRALLKRMRGALKRKS